MHEWICYSKLYIYVTYYIIQLDNTFNIRLMPASCQLIKKLFVCDKFPMLSIQSHMYTVLRKVTGYFIAI